jgi:hypothetical protein
MTKGGGSFGLGSRQIHDTSLPRYDIRFSAVTPTRCTWLHTLLFFRQPVPMIAASFLALLCIIPALPSLLDSSQLF